MNVIQILQLLAIVLPLIRELIQELRKQKKTTSNIIRQTKKIVASATNSTEAIIDLGIEIPGFATVFEKKYSA